MIGEVGAPHRRLVLVNRDGSPRILGRVRLAVARRVTTPTSGVDPAPAVRSRAPGASSAPINQTSRVCVLQMSLQAVARSESWALAAGSEES